jgi:hypothetical protein
MSRSLPIGSPAAILRFAAFLFAPAFFLTIAPADAVHAAPKIEWDAKYYNPKPDIEDLVLPLPCGGAMTFRRVLTPAPEGPMSDRPVRLGWSNPETGFADYIRRDFILGSLSQPGIPSRFYYIGKYEVTRDQFAAVMQGECKKPNMGGLLPAGGVSWFEGVDFSRRLTEWIIAKHPGPFSSGHEDPSASRRSKLRALI